MIGKSFEKVLYVVGIGVLQLLAVLGCQTYSDCHTQTKPQCCPYTIPPRCMDLAMCYYYGNDNTKLTTTLYPRVTDTDYNRFTDPDYNRFTDPDNDKFTDPDYNKFTLPDFKEFTVPHIDVPKFSYNDNNDDYSTSTPSHSTGIIPTALVILALVILSILIIVCRLLVRSSPSRDNSQQNCNVQPPSATNASQTSLVAQEDEQLSRIIMIAATRDEDHVRRHNRPPDGEPPFLSEEDILNNLQNNCAQEPPPYEETTARSHLLSYENLVNVAMEQPSSPVCPDVHTTCRSSINPSQMIPQIQQNLPIPNVNPPSYEEAQASAYQANDSFP